MPATALALYIAFIALAFGLRTWIQIRRTGSSGFHGISGRPGPAERTGGVLFVVAIVAGVVAPVAQLTDVLDPIGVLDRPAVLALGLVLSVAGLAATVAAQMSMGSSWRIGVDPSERTALVTSGAFALARNPIFSAMLLAALGLALLAPNAVALGAVPLLLIAVQIQVRIVEEPYLRVAHDQDFADSNGASDASHRAYAVARDPNGARRRGSHAPGRPGPPGPHQPNIVRRDRPRPSNAGDSATLRHVAQHSAQLDRFTARLVHLVRADVVSSDALRRLGRDRLGRLAEDAARRVADTIAWEALVPILTDQQVLERCVELSSLEAVDEANINGHLVEVRDVHGEPLGYPAFQLRHGELLPGLLHVLEALWDERVTVDRWQICRWLTSPEAALDGLSPADCLRRAGGVSPAVMQCVMAFRAQAVRDGARTPPDPAALSWAIPSP